jgi:hypothetical protein
MAFALWWAQFHVDLATVMYADDFVLMCCDRAQLEQMLFRCLTLCAAEWA